LKFSRTDLTLIATPFILTALLVVIGYNILIKSTPEARINPPKPLEKAQILTNTTFPQTPPQSPVPDNPNMLIATNPDAQHELDDLLKNAQEAGVDTIYLVIPIKVSEDEPFQLSQAIDSNHQNVLAWVKKNVSTLHGAGYHVTLAPTLNATTTIINPVDFMAQYRQLFLDLAGIANEFSVSFFYTGITVGHPVYSALPDLGRQYILTQINQTLKPVFTGNTGVGYCCNLEPKVTLVGQQFLMLIPTPENPLDSLMPQAQIYRQNHELKFLFTYDRDQSRVNTLTD